MDALISAIPDVGRKPIGEIDRYTAELVLGRLGVKADLRVPVAAFDSSI